MPDAPSPLLVPIAVEALVVNQRVQNATTFHRWEMEYANLLNFMSPAPPAFSNLSESKPPQGIHLHWALPRALTRGKQVQATATAEVAGGEVTQLTVTNGGYGYSDALPPIVTVVGDGSGALVNAVVSNGIVTGLQIVQAGQGYSQPPRVTIAPSPAISFPFVPNRWLVIRYSPADSSSQPRHTRAWLLQSDAIDPNTDPTQSNSFVDPFTSSAGSIVATRLGTTAVDLGSWNGEPASANQLFLRAVGPGEATFAAYQPGVLNVFSFFDPLLDPNAKKEDTQLSYLVIGWYSDPAHDPLYGPIKSWDAHGCPTRNPWTDKDGWQSLINDLDWSVTAAEKQAALPSQSLFHGSVYGVTWQQANLPPIPIQSADKITVAVGNTSIDALSAIVQKYADTPEHGSKEAEMLEAFQYNFLKTLDQPDGEAQLELLVRQAWFGSTPGGTTWQVVGAQTAETQSGQLAPDSVPPPPPLTPDQQTALGELNRAQRDLDQANRLLASMQWELYATWWKKNRITAIYNGPAPGQLDKYLAPSFDQLMDGDDPENLRILQNLIQHNLDPSKSDGLLYQVIQQQNVVRAQMQILPNPTNSAAILSYATSKLGLDPNKFRLKASAMPRFYQPVDPVVLVSGIPISEKQGQLTDGPLACRFVSQAVTGVNLQVVGHNQSANASTGSIQSCIPIIGNPHLPATVNAGIQALNSETFFVDPNDAATILMTGFDSTDQTSLNQLVSAMTAQTAQTSPISNPLSAAVAFSNWTQQPWSPLYLEWDVTFYPTVQPYQLVRPDPNDPTTTIADDDWQFSLPPLQQLQDQTDSNGNPLEQPGSWIFDGTDFTWSGGYSYVLDQESPPIKTTASQSYVGRTFLTPQSTYILIDRLKKFLADNANADLDAVNKLIDQIGDWNFLSQRLSGLIDQMIMRDLTQGQPPDASIAERVGEQFHAVPDPNNGTQSIDYGGGTPFFFPVCGGALQFNRLTVVDTFGQTLDLMSAGGNIGTGVPWAPVRGQGLAPSPNTQLPQPSEIIQITPRLVQTSRLNFRFISATNDQHETGLWPDSSPVCGWVLPNHLDQGLAVYDAAGNALGELLPLADTAGNINVTWLPAPDTPSAINDLDRINPHLSKFVLALSQAHDQGDNFKNFLQVVDETLWTVDPLGSRADQNLSVLIGRPLALVRAQLQFELEGQPVFNQSWRDTLQNRTGGIEGLQFPIRLGSLDLYDDGLMGYFLGDNYTTFNSVHQPDGFQPGPGSYLNPIGYNQNYINLAFNYPNYSTQLITMLLDPRGDVHAYTGILPVKTVSLPTAYFADALAKMALTFRTGPVLTEAERIRIPYPTEKNGSWSWIQRSTPADPQHWNDPSGWKIEDITKADQNARLPHSPARLLEGWLKLTPTDIESNQTSPSKSNGGAK